MIWTSFFALKNLGVPMATVLKNLTNLFTIGGDYLLYGKVRPLAERAKTTSVQLSCS
jgi:GDP-mannose transporter